MMRATRNGQGWLLCGWTAWVVVLTCYSAAPIHAQGPMPTFHFGPPQGLGPSAFPVSTEWTQDLQIPPPPLPVVGQELETPAKINAPTPTVVSTDEGQPEARVVQWYYPWTWFPWDGWTNSMELGANGSDGNSESFSLLAGMRFKRKAERSLFEYRLTHNRTKTTGIESQNNVLMFVDYERLFPGSKWSWFNKLGLEYDEFKAFDLRLNLNSGVGYRWIDNETLRLATRFGAGTSREFGGPDDRWVPEAVFGGDYDHQINKRNKVIVKVDYFPEWTNFANYRVVSDLAWEYLLDEKNNLSLKLSANDRYDSTPNGRKPNDLNYGLLLLYKF